MLSFHTHKCFVVKIGEAVILLLKNKTTIVISTLQESNNVYLLKRGTSQNEPKLPKMSQSNPKN